MAKSTGNAAKSISRLCFTLVNVTTPTAVRNPPPTKFAVAEKHTGHPLPCEDYTDCRGTQNISPHPAVRVFTPSRIPQERLMALILCRQVDLRSVPRLSLELSENSFQRAHF